MKFVFLKEEGADEARNVLAKLDALGHPAVVFPQEIFEDVRSPVALHAVMKRLGYCAIQPPSGGRWRWYGSGQEFASRWAYIDEKLAPFPARISALLDARGQEKVGPRVGPFAATLAPRKGDVGPRKGGKSSWCGRSSVERGQRWPPEQKVGPRTNRYKTRTYGRRGPRGPRGPTFYLV